MFRSVEIMKLISNVLNFTDEQQVIVGIKVPPPSNLISSIYSVFSGSNLPKDTPAVDASSSNGNASSLAELWVDFLLQEASVKSPQSSKSIDVLQSKQSIELPENDPFLTDDW